MEISGSRPSFLVYRMGLIIVQWLLEFGTWASMDAIAWRVLGLFLPAGLGLLVQLLGQADWAERSLALATVLLSFDLACMAIVDLQQSAIGQPWSADCRVVSFRQVTQWTLGLELLGFYGALVNLGWGATIILCSQVGFNLLANIQIQPQAKVVILPWGWRDRGLVLLADTVGLGLVGLWLAGWARLEAAIVLLAMVLIYSGVKLSFWAKDCTNSG
jgi:hypothetical protein